MKLLIVVLLALGVLVLEDFDNIQKEKEMTATEEAFIYDVDYYSILDDGTLQHFDAEKLLCTLSDNLMNDENLEKIDNAIRGKWIKLTGIVSNISYDYIDGCRISILQQRENGQLFDGWNAIICYFNDEKEIKKASQLESGDKITLIGYCKGLEIFGPELNNCYLKPIKKEG